MTPSGSGDAAGDSAADGSRSIDGSGSTSDGPAGRPDESPEHDGADHADERADDRILRPGGAGGTTLGRWGGRGTAVVLSLATVALLLVGFLIGFAVSGSDSRDQNSLVSQVPTIDSVEAGFSRDMITHHRQGVTMGNFAAHNTEDLEILNMAEDISSTQLAQIGQMEGWLALWQLPEQLSGSRMAWMATGGHGHGEAPSTPSATASAAPAGGSERTVDNSAVTTVIDTADDSGVKAVMPGMATSGEMSLLESLRGKDSDIYFLQLMIRHHEGGEAMMNYAVDHATNPVVKNFAYKMRETQISEIAVMTQMLQARGAEPLPFDAGN